MHCSSIADGPIGESMTETRTSAGTTSRPTTIPTGGFSVPGSRLSSRNPCRMRPGGSACRRRPCRCASRCSRASSAPTCSTAARDRPRSRSPASASTKPVPSCSRAPTRCSKTWAASAARGGPSCARAAALRSPPRGGRGCVVGLGWVDSFAAAVGPVLYRALSSTTQQVRLWSGLTPSLTSQFVNRQLDLMITTATSMAGSGVGHTPIFTEQYVLVMPRDYAFDAFCSFSDLGRKLPLIRYSARSTIGDDIDAFLARHGDELERTCEFDTTDPLLSLVSAGLGFAITTPMCL